MGGPALSVYGAYDVNDQWKKHKLSNGQMVVEQISNAIGAVPAYGSAWTLGWEASKYIGPSYWYGTDDTKWLK